MDDLQTEAKRKLRAAAHTLAYTNSRENHDPSGERYAAAEAELYLAALAYAHTVYRPKQARQLIARQRAKRGGVQ